MYDWIIAASARDATDDFNSTITLVRPDPSSTVWNGSEYVSADVTVYSGGARVRSQGTSAVAVQAGDRPFTLRTYDVQVPATVAADIDDTVTVVTSRDTQAVGVTMRVIDVPKTEWVSVRTLVAVEET